MTHLCVAHRAVHPAVASMAPSICRLLHSTGFTCRKSHVPISRIRSACRYAVTAPRIRPIWRHWSVPKAGLMDTMPAWTLDQIAGMAFGVLLVSIYFSSGLVDKYVARVQRAELGLCEECGGLYDCESCPKPNCPSRHFKE